MLTLLISFIVGVGCFSAAYWAGDFGMGWSVTVALLAFGASQVIATLLVQKRVRADMMRVQGILTEGQKRIQVKMQRWQLRPPGSVQAAQKEILADTRVFVKEAIAETECLRRYRLWVPMIERQIATAKMQLHWMVKDFAAVDQLLPKALLVDPAMVAMKIARMYMTNRPSDEIAKVYAKGVRRTRYNGNVLIAAVWSWIQVQRNDADGAFKTLTEALRKSDNETLKRNHELLMNNRVAHFSNSGLGDQWYSLQLEEPKVHVQRQRSVYR